MLEFLKMLPENYDKVLSLYTVHHQFNTMLVQLTTKVDVSWQSNFLSPNLFLFPTETHQAG